MRWFYHDGSNQVGPYLDADMIALAQRGSIRADTMVWQEGTPAWTPANATGLAAYLPAPAPQPLMPPPMAFPAPVPPPMNFPAAPTMPHASDPQGAGVASDMVLPRNPPRSVHLSLLGILIPGLYHFIIGQPGKGGLLLGLCFVSFFGTGPIGPWITAIFAVIDGYAVGKVLRSGRPVKKMAWFPT